MIQTFVEKISHNSTTGVTTIVVRDGARNGAIVIEGDADVVSDGHHSFGDLYEHRAALLCTLSAILKKHSVKSRKNSDGSEWDGLFIVQITLPTGPISYHIPLEYWDLFKIPEIATITWDGHTPEEVTDRLLNYVRTYVK